MLRRGRPVAPSPPRPDRLARHLRGAGAGGVARRNLTGKLVSASHNDGKVREIAELLAPHGVEAVSAVELDLPEPDEIGVSFIENADLKARQAADLSGLPALADDSGLCVEA